jgi:hypothetical protein
MSEAKFGKIRLEYNSRRPDFPYHVRFNPGLKGITETDERALSLEVVLEFLVEEAVKSPLSSDMLPIELFLLSGDTLRADEKKTLLDFVTLYNRPVGTYKLIRESDITELCELYHSPQGLTGRLNVNLGEGDNPYKVMLSPSPTQTVDEIEFATFGEVLKYLVSESAKTPETTFDLIELGTLKGEISDKEKYLLEAFVELHNRSGTAYRTMMGPHEERLESIGDLEQDPGDFSEGYAQGQ